MRMWRDSLLKINELRDGQRKVDIEGIITDVKNPRDTKTGSKVANATLEDDTGQVKLPLWDEQIEQVAKGSRVRVLNGYTNAYNGEVQLNVGKYGRLEVLGEAGVPPAPRDIKQGTLSHDGPFSPMQEARIRAIIAEELYGKPEA